MLAILYRTVEGCPVLVAANREESYDRQGTPPQAWEGDPAIVAGRDPRAGGTWLGVNQHGVLVAMTNRPKVSPRSPARSRGLLCRDLLNCHTARAAHERAIEELDHQSYAGCNVLTMDSAGAYVIQAGGLLRSCPLPPGIHVVTARDLNDTSDARIAHAFDRLACLDATTLDDWMEQLTHLCSDHGSLALAPICLHAADRGTVSSTVIALADNSMDARWLHAQGPPCRNPFADHSHLLTGLLSVPSSGGLNS